MGDEGPTQEYRRLAEDGGAAVRAMDDETLLRHYLQTRLMIEHNDPIYLSGAATNALRMGYVFTVAQYERNEILQRMRGAS
jgi:hypothetical protein